MNQEAKILLEKYNAGSLSPAEEEKLELFIEQGIIELEMLEDIHELGNKLSVLFSDTLSREMRQDFYQLLEQEKEKLQNPIRQFWEQLDSFFNLSGNQSLAYGLAFIALGLFIGLNMRPASGNQQEIAQLSNDLQDMREMMMLTLLEKQSSSERLKAVSLTNEMPQASEKVTKALLQTLNEDPNVNVRLSALDALLPYATNPEVRSGLIASIQKQESPMVQVALAEVMEALQEKNAVRPLKELLDQERMPEEVKEKIEQSISTLL
jgi:HEAT repeat protein